MLHLEARAETPLARERPERPEKPPQESGSREPPFGAPENQLAEFPRLHRTIHREAERLARLLLLEHRQVFGWPDTGHSAERRQQWKVKR